MRTFSVHLVPYRVGVIDLHIDLPNNLNLPGQINVKLGADAAQFGLAFWSGMSPLARRADLQRFEKLARPQRPCGFYLQNPSGIESAAEFRLGQKKRSPDCEFLRPCAVL